MDYYLVKTNHVEDVPPNAYLFYRMDPGGIYYCMVREYRLFCRYLSTVGGSSSSSSSYSCLTMDLSHTRGHAVVFDIDIRFPSRVPSVGSTRDIMLAYFEKIFFGSLKSVFSPVAKHYTVLVAARGDRKGGLHVHMPEMQIAYDDYVLLCTHLQGLSSVDINELDAIVQFKSHP